MNLPLATPELRPRCCETVPLCLPVTRRKGCNPSSLLSFTLHISRVLPSRFPPNRFYPTPYPLVRLHVARLPSRWSGLTALRMGGSPSHPSLSHPPTSLRDIKFGASEPLLVLWASGVQIRYSFRVEVNAIFSGAFHRHRGLFSAHPLSTVLQ